MDVMAPFYKLGYFGDGFSLVIALTIGFFFGLFIERGGLGNANKLAGQFYFTDFTVFKLMFSAVVTAMIGLFWLSKAGVLDLSLVFVNPTYVYPQIIAGLIFGVGFVIGGLCPGTSVVALASGRMDGLALLIGIFTGIFLFGEIFDSLTTIFYSGSYGALTLPTLLSLQPGSVVLIIVVIALTGFTAAEIYEGKIKFSAVVPVWPFKGLKRLLAVIAIVSAVAAASVGSPIPSLDSHTTKTQISGVEINYITPLELAQLVMQRTDNMQLVDGRTTAEFDDYHLPFAQQSHSHYSGGADNLVVYFADYEIPEVEWLKLHKPGRKIRVLLGGMQDWRREVLFPYLVGATDLSEFDLNRRANISHYFGGQPKLPLSAGREKETYAREGC
jgi:uncharacterized membrane protein YedE/YeeE